jgi:hypothetical protein
MQTGMFFAVPLGAIVLLVTALAWPPSIRHLQKLDGAFISAAIGTAVLVTFVVSRHFRAYENTPSLADPYRAPEIVRATRILFVALPVLSILLTGAILRIATLAGRLK